MKQARDAPTAIGAGFARDHDGAQWTYIGALTFENAGPVLGATSSMALPSEGQIDLENLDGIDSSAVAVLVALKRRAETEGKPLRFVRVPAALRALAEVYGVEPILGA